MLIQAKPTAPGGTTALRMAAETDAPPAPASPPEAVPPGVRPAPPRPMIDGFSVVALADADWDAGRGGLGANSFGRAAGGVRGWAPLLGAAGDPDSGYRSFYQGTMRHVAHAMMGLKTDQDDVARMNDAAKGLLIRMMDRMGFPRPKDAAFDRLAALVDKPGQTAEFWLELNGREGRRAKEEGRAPKERRQGLVRIDIDRARAVFEEKKARERRGEAFEPAKGVRAVEGNAAEDGRGGRRPAQAAAALYRDGGGEVRAWATAAVYEDSEWAAKKAFGILYVMSERLMGPHSPFEARDRAAPVAPPRRDGDPPDSGGRGPDDPGGWGPGAPDGPPPGSDAGPDKGKDKQNNRDKDKGVGQSGEKSHGHGTAWHDGPDGGGAPGGGKPPRQEDPQPERGRDRR